MSAPSSNTITRRWIIAKRAVVGLAGVALSAASGFAIVIMLAFWQESNQFPNLLAEFAGTWGLLVVVIGVSIYWIVRCVRGAEFGLSDLVLLILPAAAFGLYLTLQGYL